MILMILMMFNDFNGIDEFIIALYVLQELWPPSRWPPGGWGGRAPPGGGLDGFLKETQGKLTGRHRVHSPGPASAVYYLLILMKFNEIY